MSAPDRPPIELLISDLDGTLVTPDKRLTDAAVAAVHELDAAGVKFTLVSSRPPRGMAEVVRELGIELPFAGFNGGALVGPDLAPIEQRVLDAGAVQDMLKLLAGHGVDAWLFARGEWWLRDPDGPKVSLERRTVGFDPQVVADFEPVIGEVNKLVAVGEDEDLIARLETEAQLLLGERATVDRSQPYYLDVTHPEANKGHAVRALCRLIGQDQRGLAVIGDMGNDLPMFPEAALSIAMGQSPQSVADAADAVTSPNTEDGFARAVRELVLPRARRR